MSEFNVDLPEDVKTDIDQFALHLIESGDLPDDVQTITTGKYAGNQALKVIASGGHDSQAGDVVQQLANEFFGVENYACGHYEDDTVSRTSIVPPQDT